MGGAVTGIVTGGLLIPLAVGTAILSNEEDNTPSLALGGVFTLTLGVGVPIAAVGASSGSEKPATGLMVTGWIGYALALTNAFALIGIGAAEADISYEPFIAATGVLGLASCAAFASAALFSDAAVKRRMKSQPSLTWRPHVSAVRDRSQAAVPTFGLALSL